MGFNIEWHNDANGTDVPWEGDNNSACVMNNDCDVSEQLRRFGTRYG